MQRNPKVCLTCRRRKVKCDKEMPVCSTCSSRGSLCSYEYKRWRINSRLRDNENVTKLVISDEDSVGSENYGDDVIDFYSTTFHTPVTFSDGPLTWVAFTKKDRFLNVVILTQTIKNKLKDDKFEQNISIIDCIKKWNKGFSDLVLNNQDEAIVFKDGDLIKSVEAVLTNSKIVWTSIEKFFESEVYIFFPFIDKDDFIEKVVELIGPPNYSDISIKLRINKSINFAYIGILLIIIRLISLSYYNFGKPVNIDKQAKLIDKNIMDFSSSVFNNLISRIYLELSIIRPPSLPIFQFIIMKFFYELYSPEQYDCLNIANCAKLGELIQYGIQCSLNIDPIFTKKDQDNNFFHNIKRNNLRRRLWYMVVCFDFLKNINSGYPVLIDETTYNAVLPDLESKFSELDSAINSCLTERVSFFNKVKPMLKLISNLKEKPKIKEFDKELTSFLDSIKDFPSIESTLKDGSKNMMERTLRLKNFMNVISTNSLLFSIYYHLFIFYSERQSVSKTVYYLIELVKITKVLYKPLLFIDPNIKDFNIHTQFGSPILLFPTLETGFHKSASIFFGILSRIKALKISKGSEISHSVLIIIDEMLDIIEEAYSYMFQQFTNTSDIYFHTWLLSKIQSSVIYRISRVPKGALLYSDLTEVDVHFKQALSKTSGESKTLGDLGFEMFSANDLQKLLDELRSFKEIYNRGDPLNKLSLLNHEVITEIDKKWVKKMLHEMGHGLTDSFNISRDHNNSAKDPVNIKNHENTHLHQMANDDNLKSLDFVLNSSELDDVLDFKLATFFGIDGSDNSWFI